MNKHGAYQSRIMMFNKFPARPNGLRVKKQARERERERERERVLIKCISMINQLFFKCVLILVFVIFLLSSNWSLLLIYPHNRFSLICVSATLKNSYGIVPVGKRSVQITRLSNFTISALYTVALGGIP